ncbi:MAG: DUF1573 domain-containing protein [Thermoanaerobaculia bacterium]
MRNPISTSWILILSLLLVGGASPALAAARAVVQESIIDVGNVAQGTRIEHSFVLENQGDEALAVREVKPSCGCTVADYPSSIAAGDSGRIAAVVKTDNFTGPIAKSVSVFTSDADNPKITLVIKAVIQPQVEVEPGYARFIVIEGPGTESSSQTLRTLDGPELVVRSVRSPYPFVKVSFAPTEEKGEWQVNLSIDRNRAPIGPLADFVEVETNHPKRRIIKIPVSGFVRPVVSVTPRVAELGSHRLEAPFTTTLEVRNQTGAAIALQAVSADIAGLNASFEEVEEGKVYKVVLTLTPGMAKGPFQGKVQITTSSKRRPVVEVDVSGTVL